MISYICLTLVLMTSSGYTPFILVTVGSVKYRHKVFQHKLICPYAYLISSEVWKLSQGVVFLTTMQCGIKAAAGLLHQPQFNVQALYCTHYGGQSLLFTFPALLLSLLYKLIQNVHNITKDAGRRLYRLFNSAVGRC